MTHKYGKSRLGGQPGKTIATGCGTVFRDTKPATKNPLKEQFAPSPDYPIRSRQRMGGVN